MSAYPFLDDRHAANGNVTHTPAQNPHSAVNELKRSDQEKAPELPQENPPEYQIGTRKFMVTKITLPRRVATT